MKKLTLVLCAALLGSALVVAATDEDVRAGALIHIHEIEEELQHPPVVEIEMVFAERGEVLVGV